MTDSTKLVKELEVLASTIRSTPDYIQTPDAIDVGAAVIPYLPMIIDSLKSTDDRITQRDTTISDLIDLLTKATADISASLFIAGKKDAAYEWCKEYIDTINAYDAANNID